MHAVLLLIVAASLAFASAAESRDADAPHLPEFFLTSISQPHCLMLVEFAESARESRKQSLLKFMDHSYTSTDQWKNSFIPLAIDYVDYTYMHVIDFKACSPSSVTVYRQLLSPYLSVSKVSPVDDDDFISTAQQRMSFVSTPDFFRAYHFDHLVSQCTVSASELRSSDSVRVHNMLVQLWLRYRVSIAEIWQVNKTVYIAFSRQCDRKEALYHNLMALAERDKLPLSDLLEQPNFSPDMKEYFSSHGQ